MTSSRELDNLGKAIAEIGKGRSCFTGQIIKEAKEALFKKGHEGAELYAAGLAEADEFTELLRVLIISSRKVSVPGEKSRTAASLAASCKHWEMVLNHPLGVLVEHGVVFDDDQGVAGSFFKNGHDLGM